VDNGNGTFTFTPDANYNGPNVFTYTVSDGNGGTVAGTRSLTVTAVNDAPTGTVTVTGTFQTGQTLTASNTVADADNGLTPLGIAYQWQNSADGVTWNDIASATSDTYTLTPADGGLFVRADARYTDVDSTQENVASTTTTRVLVVGTSGADSFPGSSAPDAFDGLAGNDIINGLGGDDTLSGGADNDTLNGGTGNDTLTGGDGVDTADYSDRSESVSVRLSDGFVSSGGDSYFVRGPGTGSNINAYKLVSTPSTYSEALSGAAGGLGGGRLGGLGGGRLLLALARRARSAIDAPGAELGDFSDVCAIRGPPGATWVGDFFLVVHQ
jgi:hypothetical protein